MEFAKTSNSNNRKLQERLKVFQNRELQPETRKLREFTASPEATKTYIANIREEARQRKIQNVAYYTIMILFISALIYYFFWHIFPLLDF